MTTDRRTNMTPVPDRSTFETMYAGKAPWDIGKPQQALVDAADQITGAILDAGCGTGENALFFAAKGHNVTGIDFLEEPIRRAKQKSAERGVQAKFLVTDALTLNSFSERFDSVIDCGLFHVFSDDDRKRYVAGLATVLKPGGKLFLMCFSDAEPGTEGPRRVAQKELHDAFAKGWNVESIKPSRFEVIPDLKDFNFSKGGPKAWFAVVQRR
jgi:ubiquinone/menaquinone biosynthesis C-methylase UbiE